MTGDQPSTMRATPVVELLYTDGCAHLDATRSLINACIAEVGVPITVIEREGAYASPTVLVDGTDVTGRPPAGLSAACRLDLPTRQQILEALQS